MREERLRTCYPNLRDAKNDFTTLLRRLPFYYLAPIEILLDIILSASNTKTSHNHVHSPQRTPSTSNRCQTWQPRAFSTLKAAPSTLNQLSLFSIHTQAALCIQPQFDLTEGFTTQKRNNGLWLKQRSNRLPTAHAPAPET